MWRQLNRLVKLEKSLINVYKFSSQSILLIDNQMALFKKQVYDNIWKSQNQMTKILYVIKLNCTNFVLHN